MPEIWYPVIDYQKCEECGACIKNCTRNVYNQAKTPTPVVANPSACEDHCHDCGNLCPQGAITYVGEDTAWMPPRKECRESSTTAKKLTVDFLYLDLHTCERCMAANDTLKEAVAELADVLHTLGYAIQVNKVNIVSREMAEQYRFVSSPTVRVNGRDICQGVKESTCLSCGDLCGDDVVCRVFVYNGTEYEQPPKAMIIDGILKTIYGQLDAPVEAPYVLPKNLETFFTGKETICCPKPGCCNR